MTSAPDTRRLTVAQAVATFPSRQYSVADGQRRRLVPATLAEVSALETTTGLRAEYETDLASQRWFG